MRIANKHWMSLFTEFQNQQNDTLCKLQIARALTQSDTYYPENIPVVIDYLK